MFQISDIIIIKVSFSLFIDGLFKEEGGKEEKY